MTKSDGTQAPGLSLQAALQQEARPAELAPAGRGAPSSKQREAAQRLVVAEVLEKVKTLLTGKDLIAATVAEQVQVAELVEQHLVRHNTWARTTPEPVLVDVPGFTQHILDSIFGFGILESLMQDPGITDILIQGPSRILYVKEGELEVAQGLAFADEEELLTFIRKWADREGKRIDQGHPMADIRLPKGHRMNVVIPSISVSIIAVTIRCHRERVKRLVDLVTYRTATEEVAALLVRAVEARITILISGATGSGKTALLNVLATLFPTSERIVTVEDTWEIKLHGGNYVQLVAREDNVEKEGKITIRDLVRNALRMFPDRIIVGEVRGEEALDMLFAQRTGHRGSIATIHGENCRDALDNLRLYAARAPERVPLDILNELIAKTINLVIQLEKAPKGRRRIVSIHEVVGFEQGTILTNELYTCRAVGAEEEDGTAGDEERDLRSTGCPILFLKRLSR